MASRRQHGFTLVELLVVVAIIALLLGILLPSLGAARRVAVVTACAANLGQIGKGVVGYSVEHGVIPHGPQTVAAGSFEVPQNGDVATSQVRASSGALGGKPSQAIAMGLLQHASGFGPNAFYCPGDDTNNKNSELPKLKDEDYDGHVFASYSYRQRQQTGNGTTKLSAGRLEALGEGSDGFPAAVLAFDLNSRLSMPGQARSNHEGEKVNAVFIDGSVTGFRNETDDLSLRDQDFSFNDPYMTARLGEILQDLDEAYQRGGDFEPGPND